MHDEALVRIVLMAPVWLDRVLPAEWTEQGVVVILVSEADEFEEVGRQLLAAGEAEIRERLRQRGICEYLMYPLSLDSLRSVIKEALRRRFGDEYLLLQAVGRGTTGIVHQAKRLKDGQNFALKEINTRRLTRTAKQDVERETQLLQELSWPTVVFVVDAWESSSDHLRFLLMPLLQGGNLLQRTEQAIADETQQAPYERVFEWYAQTLHGLCYLHWRGVLHRDLKPGNLLLAADGVALQIGDLGSAALLPGPGPHPSRRNCVRGQTFTPAYASPEVLSEGAFMSSSDVWSVGSSFYEIITMKSLIPADTPSNQMKDLVMSFDADSRAGPAPGGHRNFAAERMSALSGFPSAPAAELAELLRQVPLRRPTAASLAARPSTARRLRRVLTDHGAVPKKEERCHFDHFERVVKESEAAADLPPPVETPKATNSEPARSRRSRAVRPHEEGGEARPN